MPRLQQTEANPRGELKQPSRAPVFYEAEHPQRIKILSTSHGSRIFSESSAGDSGSKNDEADSEPSAFLSQDSTLDDTLSVIARALKISEESNLTIDNLQAYALELAAKPAVPRAQLIYRESIQENDQVRMYGAILRMVSEYEEEYKLVTDLIDKGVITAAYLKYLFKPEAIVVGGRDHNCRVKHMVSYDEHLGQKFHDTGDGRYMIGMAMCLKLHRPKEEERKKFEPFVGSDDLGSEAVKQDHPPDGNFVRMLPLTINGDNLKKKSWLDLNVVRINEVVWNTRALDNLVRNGKIKRLIQALVSNQVEAENSTDIISGKGNGLILLLHGGPGTGKTLTAESVAEIAHKPLYPFTCGDIGTEPEFVENYLESVLYLVKTWGCVVLLDEADIFLAQLSFEDLRRNALRTQIWGNFLRHLRELNEEGIDCVDLEDNVEQLASNKMNGR
ncbi:hypothetical protein BKA67DRAFT_539096 [Truncatella angustata]|uniref:ATPase AAA-type core domain-containing protein n=1 Tax=Truncatella angustata TaxID=152316 RepID=A0A9P8ZTQ3_9PEZI|nr:uncharacterized protein BKA67DRAFT_539096 [Truncatella angustata]KAH6649100.1 hypothetical protein BKA67DRAFT_539096 [Truncatella angustata]